MTACRSLSSIARAAILSLAFVVTASPAQDAEEPRDYQVELVVFRHLAKTGANEDWNDRNKVAVNTAGETPAAEPRRPRRLQFEPLSPERFTLTEVFGKLRGSRDFRPIYQAGWIQPGYAPDEAATIRLSRIAPMPRGLGGEAKLHVSRFLHLAIDMDLRADQSEPGELDAPVYRLRETRKMRSGELHYFDHPQFGVLVRITRADHDSSNAS